MKSISSIIGGVVAAGSAFATDVTVEVINLQPEVGHSLLTFLGVLTGLTAITFILVLISCTRKKH